MSQDQAIPIQVEVKTATAWKCLAEIVRCKAMLCTIETQNLRSSCREVKMDILFNNCEYAG